MSEKPSDKIYAALHARYPQPKWVLIQEAPSTNTGGRRCDALAVGVWQSSKRTIIGHEVKVSRSDWLRELQQPEKSDAFCHYCDSWFLVAPRGVVKLEELRATWGLMELSGDSLKIRRQPEPNEAKPIPRQMMASWLRRVKETSQRDIEREVRRRVELEVKNLEWRESNEISHLTREINDLRSMVEQFEKASGVALLKYQAGRIGAAVHAVLQSPRDLAQRFRATASEHERVMQAAKEAAEELENLTSAEAEAA